MLKSFLVLCLLSGCATAPDRVRQGITIGLHAMTATASIVEEVDKQKIAEAVKKAEAGDPDGATLDLNTWDDQFTKIQKALSSLWHIMAAAADGVTAYEKGSGPKPDYSAMSVNIINAISELAKALTEAGVKVPGVTQ